MAAARQLLRGVSSFASSLASSSGEQLETRKVGLQDGAEVRLQILAHVAHRGGHALEQPASEIVDAKIHGVTSVVRGPCPLLTQAIESEAPKRCVRPRKTREKPP